MIDFTLIQNDVTIRLEEILTEPSYQVLNVRQTTGVEGGLTITYYDEERNVQVIVIGYSELGEWIEYDSKNNINNKQ